MYKRVYTIGNERFTRLEGEMSEITLSLSDARKKLTALVGRPGTTVITKHGEPESVLLDYDRYQMLFLDAQLQSSPERDRILAQHHAFQRGDLEEFEELEFEEPATK